MLVSSAMGNQARLWPMAAQWAVRLREEFASEARVAAVSPRNTGSNNFAEAHLGYIRLTLVPVVAAEVSIFSALKPVAEQLASNIEVWREKSKTQDTSPS